MENLKEEIKTSLRYFKLANPENSFYDSESGLDLIGKNVKSIPKNQSLSKIMQRALKSGHIVELTDEELLGKAKENAPAGSEKEGDLETEEVKKAKALASKIEELTKQKNEDLLELAEDETTLDEAQLKDLAKNLKDKNARAEAIKTLAEAILN